MELELGYRFLYLAAGTIAKTALMRIRGTLILESPLMKEVIDALSKPFIAGLTLIGGEPFEAENQKPLLDFVKKVRSIYENKNIWCYSGFTFDEIMGKSRASGPTAKELISYIDVLVDGRFVENLKDISLKFRGSSNQRIIDIKETLKQRKIVELKL